MATSHIYVKTATGATASGRDLLATLEQIGDGFARLARHFDAMGQQKDGDGTQASHFAVVAAVYGFTDSGGSAASNADAKAAYDEMNSFIGNCGAALKQICAKLKQ
ncbi:MAG TPA: hypothetical protein VEI97_08105 [bacterium]|nr:hypothetical protein [bacterium]